MHACMHVLMMYIHPVYRNIDINPTDCVVNLVAHYFRSVHVQ